MIKIILNKIINSHNVEEIIKVVKAFKKAEVGNMVSIDYRILKHVKFEKAEAMRILRNTRTNEMISVNVKTAEHEKLEKLVNELRSCITYMTDLEEALFSKIAYIIDLENSKVDNIRDDYLKKFDFLEYFQHCLNDINRIDDYTIRKIKSVAKETLKNMSYESQPHSLKEISELSMRFFDSVSTRMLIRENLDNKVNI